MISLLLRLRVLLFPLLPKFIYAPLLHIVLLLHLVNCHLCLYGVIFGHLCFFMIIIELVLLLL